VYPDGRKAWELRYDAARAGEKRKQTTVELGEYGEGPGRFGLAAARSEAQRLRDLIRAGSDPRRATRSESA